MRASPASATTRMESRTATAPATCSASRALEETHDDVIREPYDSGAAGGGGAPATAVRVGADRGAEPTARRASRSGTGRGRGANGWIAAARPVDVQLRRGLGHLRVRELLLQ